MCTIKFEVSHWWNQIKWKFKIVYFLNRYILWGIYRKYLKTVVKVLKKSIFKFNRFESSVSHKKSGKYIGTGFVWVTTDSIEFLDNKVGQLSSMIPPDLRGNSLLERRPEAAVWNFFVPSHWYLSMFEHSIHKEFVMKQIHCLKITWNLGTL